MAGLPLWIQGIIWGAITSSSLLIGSVIGYRFNLQQKIVAGIMAFGSGVLISALAFDLIEEAFNISGYKAVSFGFLAGAIIYTSANISLNKYGARHRKKSNLNTLKKNELENINDVGIALGALIDGIPESIIIGISLIEGSTFSLVTIIAIFISNIPEGLSSTVGMKKRGKKPAYIFGIWGGICILSAIFAGLGNLAFANASKPSIAIIMSLAAGGILAMVADTMIPEAFEETHNFTGLITVLGFLTAFILEKL